jgi:hypothetical protein
MENWPIPLISPEFSGIPLSYIILARGGGCVYAGFIIQKSEVTVLWSTTINNGEKTLRNGVIQVLVPGGGDYLNTGTLSLELGA